MSASSASIRRENWSVLYRYLPLQCAHICTSRAFPSKTLTHHNRVIRAEHQNWMQPTKLDKVCLHACHLGFPKTRNFLCHTHDPLFWNAAGKCSAWQMPRMYNQWKQTTKRRNTRHEKKPWSPGFFFSFFSFAQHSAMATVSSRKEATGAWGWDTSNREGQSLGNRCFPWAGGCWRKQTPCTLICRWERVKTF